FRINEKDPIGRSENPDELLDLIRGQARRGWLQSRPRRAVKCAPIVENRDRRPSTDIDDVRHLETTENLARPTLIQPAMSRTEWQFDIGVGIDCVCAVISRPRVV